MNVTDTKDAKLKAYTKAAQNAGQKQIIDKAPQESPENYKKFRD